MASITNSVKVCEASVRSDGEIDEDSKILDVVEDPPLFLAYDEVEDLVSFLF